MLGLPFDPNAEFNQWEHHRPHWAQTGTIVFVTFRTHDSIPRSVIATWDRMKIEWLRRHGILANNWRTAISLLRDNQRAEFQREFHRLKEICLDESLGACPLKQPELATVVSGSLLHFDGQRYQMGDFVVMPNHAAVRQ